MKKYSIGIDLGGTNIDVGLVDDACAIVRKAHAPTGRRRKDTEIVADMAALAVSVIHDTGVDMNDIRSIGVGSPGIPDDHNGTVVVNYNLGFRNTAVRSGIRSVIDLPVHIENDANCAALAESLIGAAAGSDHSITITLGTGIGGGIVINGEIYSGFNQAGSELGHMVIVVGGEQCSCGRKGCWEAYASATALIRQTKAAMLIDPRSLIHDIVKGDPEAVTAKTPFDAMAQGDETGTRLVDEYIGHIAQGTVNLINILQPEIIVFGGGVSRSGDTLLIPLRRKITEAAFCTMVPQTRIETAKMGSDAGIIGAAMLGR